MTPPGVTPVRYKLKTEATICRGSPKLDIIILEKTSHESPFLLQYMSVNMKA